MTADAFLDVVLWALICAVVGLAVAVYMLRDVRSTLRRTRLERDRWRAMHRQLVEAAEDLTHRSG